MYGDETPGIDDLVERASMSIDEQWFIHDQYEGRTPQNVRGFLARALEDTHGSFVSSVDSSADAYYVDARNRAGHRSPYSSVRPQDVDTERWSALAGWSATNLDGLEDITDDDINVSLTKAKGGLTRTLMDRFRGVVMETSNQDEASTGWERVGSANASKCRACGPLMGKGITTSEVFHSHDHCRCRAEPKFAAPRPGERLPEPGTLNPETSLADELLLGLAVSRAQTQVARQNTHEDEQLRAEVEAEILAAEKLIDQAQSEERRRLSGPVEVHLESVSPTLIEDARWAHVTDPDERAFIERMAKRSDDPEAYIDGVLTPLQYTSLRKRYEDEVGDGALSVLDEGYFATDDAFLINEALRNGETSRFIENLRSASTRWETPEPVRVYRGVWGMDLPDNMVGATWKDNGFMSTTLDSRRAVTWSQRRGENPTIFEIDVPAGTPAAMGKDQDELLIPPGSTLEILEDATEKTSWGGTIRRLKCRIVTVKK